jgi:rare lipoprotein A
VEALKIILAAEGKITQDYIKNNSLGGIDYAKSAEIIKFSDIYKSMWYYPYIKKGAEINIIGGYPDGTFKPEQTVNKAESFKMTMLADATTLPAVTEDPFADVPAGEWFAPYFLEGKNRQIVYITMGGNANPATEMTRSTFAELVYRYLKSKEGCRYGGGSFYSDWFEGRGTSSGEPYKAAELTAAHRTLPFNTIIKVTNLENGKSVTVRVNDRGPYITGRVVDLSRTAFEQIAYTGQGVIWVEYQIITPAT